MLCDGLSLMLQKTYCNVNVLYSNYYFFSQHSQTFPPCGIAYILALQFHLTCIHNVSIRRGGLHSKLYFKTVCKNAFYIYTILHLKTQNRTLTWSLWCNLVYKICRLSEFKKKRYLQNFSYLFQLLLCV